MPVALRRIGIVAFIGLSIAIASGCSAPGDDEGDDANAAQEQHQFMTALYARCRQRRLPFGLTTWREKLAKVNSHRPRRGCVAMIQTGSSFGHVAYVNDVNGSRISIDEGNWPSGHCGRRSGTPAALNVRGYWCP